MFPDTAAGGRAVNGARLPDGIVGLRTRSGSSISARNTHRVCPLLICPRHVRVRVGHQLLHRSVSGSMGLTHSAARGAAGQGRRSPSTERAARMPQADGRTGRLFGVNIDRLVRTEKMPRYAAPVRHEGTALMRHLLSLPLPIAPLSFSMSMGSAGGLVASAGAAHRFPASLPRAIPRGSSGSRNRIARRWRLASRSGGSDRAGRSPAPRAAPRSPSRRRWTAPRRRGIKGLAKLPPTALRTEGPGFDANQTTRAVVYVRLLPSA